MIKKLTTLSILIAIAWFCQPALEVILPFPSYGMLEDYRNNLDSEWLISIATTLFVIARYCIWILALWLFYKYAAPIFGFLWPLGKRFSTTKLVRRIQGAYVEFCLLASLTLIIAGLTIIQPALRDYQRALIKQKEVEAEKYFDQLQGVIFELQDDLKGNKALAIQFIQYNQYLYFVPQGIWPLDDTRSIDTYSTASEVLPWYKSAWTNITGYFSAEKQDIRNSQEYRTFFQTQKSKSRRLENARAYKIDKQDIAQKAAWEVKMKLGNPISHVLHFFNAALFWLIPSALLLYIIIRSILRRKWLGTLYTQIHFFMDVSRFGQGGSARFANLFEEWSLLLKNQVNSLYVGRSLYSPFGDLGLQDDRHMVTIGGTRSGKGTTVIIPNLLLWENSVLCIDPKGTNGSVTAEARRKMGQKVYFLDPFNQCPNEKKASFNILETLDVNSTTIREDIIRIAESMVVRSEHEKEPHWNDSSEMIISGLIAYLLLSEEHVNPHLGMIRDLISQSKESQCLLWVKMTKMTACGKLAADAGHRIANSIGTEESTNVLSNVDKHTMWLSSEIMEKTLSTSTFKLSDLKEKPTTVFLILPPHLITVHKRFMRLFINTMLTEMSRGGRSKTPVLMIMDEFLALERLKIIEEAFPLMAGYNVTLWPFLQNTQRLEKLYGKGILDTFISNSRAVQVFGCEGATKKFVSDHIGKRKGVLLREESEVAAETNTDYNKQYILRSGKPTLVLEKKPYYDAAYIKPLAWTGLRCFAGRFAGRFSPDPDYPQKSKNYLQRWANRIRDFINP